MRFWCYKMGCTTSVVVLESLRSILERNCGYIKGAAELGDLEEEEETLSLRGSQLFIPTSALVNLQLNITIRHVEVFSIESKSIQQAGVTLVKAE